MINRLMTSIVLISSLFLGLTGLVYAAGNIDPVNKWAWGSNVGWINFDPTHSQVTIDPATGVFDGYVWAENVGWIKFKGGSGATAYGVVAAFDNFSNYLPLIIKGS